MTFQVAIIPRDVGYVFFEDQKLAESIQEAYANHLVFDVTLKGKHSKGSAVGYSPEEDMAWLLKPGSGNNSPALGVNDDPTSQSRREVAFPKVARQFVSAESFLGTGLLTLDGHEVAVMDLMPVTFMSVQKAKKQASLTDLFKPYFESGEVWKWSFLDYVLGNPDRHGSNILVDPDTGKMVLIDHSSAFAGENFNPGKDVNSFVPFYLRFNAPNNFQTLSAADKYKLMSRPTAKDEERFKAWLRSFNRVLFYDAVGRYGIPTEPIRQRFEMVIASGNPVDYVNRMWSGVIADVLSKAENEDLLSGDNSKKEENNWAFGKHSPGYAVAMKLGYGMLEMQNQLRNRKLPEAAIEMLLQSGDPEMGSMIAKYMPSEKHTDMMIEGVLSNRIPPTDGVHKLEEDQVKMFNSLQDSALLDHYIHGAEWSDAAGDKIFEALSPKMQEMMAARIAHQDYEGVTSKTHEKIVDLYQNPRHSNWSPLRDTKPPSFNFLRKLIDADRPDLVATMLPHLHSKAAAEFLDIEKQRANPRPLRFGELPRNDPPFGSTSQKIPATMTPDFEKRMYQSLVAQHGEALERSGDHGLLCRAASHLDGNDLAAQWSKWGPDLQRYFAEDAMGKVPHQEFRRAAALQPNMMKDAFMRMDELSPEQAKTAINSMFEGEPTGNESISGLLKKVLKTSASATDDGSGDPWFLQREVYADTLPTFENRIRQLMDHVDPKYDKSLIFGLDSIDQEMMEHAHQLYQQNGPQPDHYRMPLDIQQRFVKRFSDIQDRRIQHNPATVNQATAAGGAMPGLMDQRTRSLMQPIFETIGLDGRLITPEFVQKLNTRGGDGSSPPVFDLTDMFIDAYHTDAEHGAALVNAAVRHVAETGNDFVGVSGRNGGRRLLSLVTPETWRHVNAQPSIPPELKRHAESYLPPGLVGVSVGAGKLRKLRAHLAGIDNDKFARWNVTGLGPEPKLDQGVHKDELKKLGFDIPSMKLGPLLDAKGYLKYSKLNQHIEALPKTQWRFSGGIWEGAQRHSQEPSKVFKIIMSEDHANNIKQAGLWPVFEKLNRWSSSGHPTHPIHGVGWVRYTSGNKGVHIDEIQTDFGYNLAAQLKQMEEGKGDPQHSMLAESAREAGITSDNVKSINKILYGDHQPNRVFHEAFLQHLRDTGHVGKRVHIWGLKHKVDENLKPGQAPPGHYLSTYKDQPDKMGYGPGKYGELDTQTNPKHKDKDTLSDTLNKSQDNLKNGKNK